MNALKVCVFLWLSAPMHAFPAPPLLISESEILAQADHAIAGRVLSGRTVFAGGLMCSAEYEVLVLESRKGSLPIGTTVRIGPRRGLAIASEYDFYLAEDKDGARRRDLMGHVLRSMGALTDHNLLACQSAFTPNMLFLVWRREIDGWPNRIAPGSRQ
jgi:hypothetical protein